MNAPSHDPNGDPESLNPPATPQVDASPEYTPEQLEKAFYSLQREQNFLLGLVGGIVAGIIGAVLWAVLTVATGFQIGWFAVGIGFLVGFAVRLLGKGLTSQFGVMGAVLSFLSVLAGNYLSIVGLVAKDEGASFMPLLTSLPPMAVLEVVVKSSSPITLLIYGIAIYEGFKFSFRKISADELQTELANGS